jgi:hypothetical protein
LSPSTSTVKYNSVDISYPTVDGIGYEDYSFPADGTVSVAGAFPGTDGGASSTMTNQSKASESALVDKCDTSDGLSKVHLAAGTATFG